MEIEVLLSTMNLKNKEDLKKLLNKMNNLSNITVINQIKENIPKWEYVEDNIKLYSYYEIGVSKSRNKALNKASGDIEILADDDIIYDNNYKEIIKDAYNKYKDADIIAFYVESTNKLRSVKKQKTHKINWITAMRIQTVQITLKNDSIKNSNIRFKEKIGPGCKYCLGEESIFLYDALKNKKKMYYIDKKIGTVNHKQSTWFKGYDKSFFYSEGAALYEISSKAYLLLILQFVLRKRKLYKNNFKMIDVIKIMLKGAMDYKSEKISR